MNILLFLCVAFCCYLVLVYLNNRIVHNRWTKQRNQWKYDPEAWRDEHKKYVKSLLEPTWLGRN